MTESTEPLGTPAGTADDEDPTRTAEAGGDFAAEHDSATFASQLDGGPEGAPEPEAPRGLAGADGA